ncbi:MAG: GTA-gp10 family protein [Alphaproteobacteria bacterium]
MTNQMRGDVDLRIEGELYRLRLTLGALAEIEYGLGLGSLLELTERLRAPTVADLAIILAALLRGGGHDMANEALLTRQIDLSSAAQAIAAAFAAAGLGAQ